MGCKELIEALKSAGDEKLRTMRAEAEEEAERIRAEAGRRVEAVRAEFNRRRAAEAARYAETILSEANAAARAVRIRSQRTLAERIERIARSSLRSLRNVGYEAVFAAFVQELPSYVWKAVRVNPDDTALAQAHFPDAEIISDKNISGGFIVISEGDQVRVDNTFEKRLERLWDDLLLDIMKEAVERCR